MKRLAETGSDNLRLGIRPEFIELTEPNPDSCPAIVEDVEDLGTYQILTAQLEGQGVKVRLSEDIQVERKQVVHLHFPARWLKLYVDEFLVEASP